MRCAGPADRTHEGLETDWYACRACGERFGICFDASGGSAPPDEPMYPPTAEERAAIRRFNGLDD